MEVPISPSVEGPAGNTVFGIDHDKVALIKATVAEGATADELKLFLYQCSRTALDPLAKQIYFQKRFNKRRNRYEMTVITGIDGYRLVADRTGKYAGNDDPLFDDEADPKKATVTVYKLIDHVRCPFTASARWTQYYPGDELRFMWRKMPHLMLGKCAEALALRKAFPAELSGIYIKEEMDQADHESGSSVVQARPRAAAPAPALELTMDHGGSRAAKVDDHAEVYSGTESQRTALRQAFTQYKLDNRDKHAIAAALKGQPMATLDGFIAQFLRSKGAASG